MTAARDDAHRACVLDIVREHIDTRYLPTMLAAREHEKAVWDTYDALRAGGDEQTAVAVAQALRDSKGRLAMTPTAEPERGKRFLAELRLAPALAQLESE
jgi:hypothetical protein